MLIHDPSLVIHFGRCCAIAEVVDAGVGALIGQCQCVVRVLDNDGIGRIHPQKRGALPTVVVSKQQLHWSQNGNLL